MKKIILAILTVITVLSTGAVAAYAAPEQNNTDPFDGVFNGRVYGDNGSSAPITLNLSQIGHEVDGTVFLGSGLYIDAGLCGSGYVPAGTQIASGRTSPANPRHLDAGSSFNVEGFNVSVDLDGAISPNGDVISTKAKIDLPWLCGGDPVLAGTLYKAG